MLLAGSADGQLQKVGRYQVDSLEALGEADTSRLESGTSVWVEGYASRGDGGQGRFWLDTSGDLGADAANGGTIVSAQGGTTRYWRRYHKPGVLHASWFGVQPGKTDVQPALKRAFRAASQAAEKPVVRIAPGAYHLAKPLTVARRGLGIEGQGAIFDNTIEFRDKQLWVKGLTVRGVKDGPGFKWHRSQQGIFVMLTATECRDGFVLGGDEFNQVTLGTWIQPVAVDNDRHGFVLDGSNRKNWVNHNALQHPLSRGNGGKGFLVKGISNYNTFYMPQSEGNGGISVQDEGNENSWIGGHYVSQSNGVAFAGGYRSYVFGGRSIGEITGADTVLMRSPSAPKARRLDKMRMITVDRLDVFDSLNLPSEYASPVPDEAIETRTEVVNYGSGTKHQLRIDLNKLDGGNSPYLDVITRGAANLSGRKGQNFHLRLNVSAFGQNGGWVANVQPVQQQKCEVIGSRVIDGNTLVIRFRTTNLTKPTSTDVIMY